MRQHIAPDVCNHTVVPDGCNLLPARPTPKFFAVGIKCQNYLWVTLNNRFLGGLQCGFVDIAKNVPGTTNFHGFGGVAGTSNRPGGKVYFNVNGGMHLHFGSTDPQGFNPCFHALNGFISLILSTEAFSNLEYCVVDLLDRMRTLHLFDLQTRTS